MARFPSVQTKLVKGAYNLMCEVLQQNVAAANNAVAKQEAEKLYYKVTHYAQTYNEMGVEFVNVRFFPDEAAQLIFQFIIQSGNFIASDDVHYDRLVQNLSESESNIEPDEEAGYTESEYTGRVGTMPEDWTV